MVIRVDVPRALKASEAVDGDADELRAELTKLSREWDSVVSGWSGAAASAYASLWEDWHDGAAKLTETLAEISTTAWPGGCRIRRPRGRVSGFGALHCRRDRAVMRYRVELDELVAFVAKLQAFERRVDRRSHRRTGCRLARHVER